ncbi:unnamed protein product [Urochloa humidicola]
MPTPASPGEIVLCAFYVLACAVLLVLLLGDFCNPPPAEGGAGGGQLHQFPDGGSPGSLAPYGPRIPATAAAPVLPAVASQPALPYFPYAAVQGGPRSSGGQASMVVVCAICLDPLRRGQPCSEVPACRHTFHRDCVDTWARSSSTCPLCRVQILVPCLSDAARGIDMV